MSSQSSEKAANKADAAEREKILYFKRLEVLNNSSDEEQDTNDFGNLLRHRKKPPTKDTSAKPVPEKRRQIAKKISIIHRTTSTPIAGTSMVEGSSPIIQRALLDQAEFATPTAFNSSIVEETCLDLSMVKETPLPVPAGASRPAPEQRSISNPAPGSGLLALPYSAGITALLGNKKLGSSTENIPPRKKARKAASFKLVPEPQRIFADKVFYFIPPDDKAPLRRARITKAREYGATWTQELVPGTTHIIAEKHLSYKNIMKFLKFDSVPEGVLMVYDEYLVDCLDSRSLCVPLRRHIVNDQQKEERKDKLPPDPLEKFDISLQVKGMGTGNGRTAASTETPPRSHEYRNDDSRSLLPEGTRENRFPNVMENLLEEPQQCVSPANNALFSDWPGGELYECINYARTVEGIPLDDEDDEDGDDRPSFRDCPEDSGSDSECQRPTSNAGKKRKRPNQGGFNQENFACMTGGTGVSHKSNPNLETLEIFQRMAEHYDRIRDRWRPYAYRKACGVLRRQLIKIETYEQAIALPHIGERLALKIEEINLTGRLRRLEFAEQEPDDAILKTFNNIYGVGISQASKWVQQGFKTLEDLKDKARLTDNQRLGIEHYDDFLTRIPRDEVTALGEVVKRASAIIDSKVEVIIGGSYRRGATSSNDIDCIMTKPNTSTETDLVPFLKKLVQYLTKTGFLVAALVTPSETGSKWHGCCVLPTTTHPIWRRIDFLLAPAAQLGTALIYFTGDDIFNRSLRLLASKKGMRLNQRGLYKDVMRGPGHVKMNEGLLIEGADEKKIFAALGVPYRRPELRICH
ncbi:hypothetical protein B0O99DRAFT_673098 [Bisporella sp. PMI_857]|nr:hypothetical protein B0O99DRAFT_673098 [Bisporella sp. PMI_857]